MYWCRESTRSASRRDATPEPLSSAPGAGTSGPYGFEVTLWDPIESMCAPRIVTGPEEEEGNRTTRLFCSSPQACSDTVTSRPDVAWVVSACLSRQ